MCSGQAPVFEAYQAMLVKKVLEHDLQSGACTNRDGSPVYVLRLLAEHDPRVREGDAGECLRMPGGVASVSGDGCVRVQPPAPSVRLTRHRAGMPIIQLRDFNKFVLGRDPVSERDDEYLIKVCSGGESSWQVCREKERGGGEAR